VLIAGESWVTSSTHYKGWDHFSNSGYATGVTPLKNALEQGGCQVTFLPNHLADTEFPNTREGLSAYDVVILSDIGANTLLLHPDTWVKGLPSPNRLKLLREWVADGGALAMCGGYYSFQGIYGAARYHRTPVEEVLPVNILPYDDRVEVPEGCVAEVVDPGHPILAGVEGQWPALLGFNEVAVKPTGKLLAKYEQYPLLAVGEYGKGRTLAWMSDIGPHWCPEPFVQWPGYARIWNQAVAWLARR
jgi:uncharacterized membrane protein